MTRQRSETAGFDVAGLARVTAELGAAITLQEVVDAAVTHITDAIGASVATLVLVENGALRMIGGRGMRAGIEEQWSAFALDDDNPASEAARTVRPVMIDSSAELDARYPTMRGQLPDGRSLLVLPVARVGGPPAAAVLGLTFEDRWLPDGMQLDMLTTFATACGQALDRLAAAEQVARQSERLTFLADASAALASSLDYRTTLQTVASLAVPELATWCAVDVQLDTGPATVAIAHVDPAKVAWAWELQTRYPSDPDAPGGSERVMRTGISELYSEIPDELLVAAARDPEHLQLSRDLQMHSALIVPLTARGQTHGTLSMIRAEAGRAYDDSDLALAEDLGRRAGLAIDNAKLFAQARDVALQLQRAVLPETITDIPGWEVATYYAPGGSAEVGGDFYDALLLPDGRLAVVIGDVMGHGLPAAAGMAQLRAAVRAYLAEDPDPVAVLRHLDHLFDFAAPTRMATMVIAVIDASLEQVTLVNAGHYPPLVVDADGAANLLWTTARPPLGAGSAVAESTTVPLAATSTLLLYTDGLAERRGEILDDSLERLARQSAVLTAPSLRSALHTMVDALGVNAADDDVTALVVRRVQP